MKFYKKKIDDIDIKILSLLQDDAMISVQELSDKVGLSTTPCWNRLQKLQELGIIKKKITLINSEKLGFANRVFVFIRTNKHKKDWSDKLREYVIKQPNVLGMYRISGNYDYLIDVICRDIKGFDSFYQKLIENIEVFDVSSSFVMEIMKEKTEFPINSLLSSSNNS